MYTHIAGDMAAWVQRGGKLPLSNNGDGSENSCCCIMRFSGEKIFYGDVFCRWKFSPHHESCKCILSDFKGLKFKSFPGEHAPGPPSCLTLTRSKWAAQLRNSVSDNQSSPFPRDLSIQLHLVRFLVGSHLRVKTPGYRPAPVLQTLDSAISTG